MGFAKTICCSLLLALFSVSAAFAAPPDLAVSTLADGAGTSNPVLNVAGTASDADGISSVTISGFPVTLNPDGSFSHSVLLQSGTTTVTIDAIDNAGNRSSDIRHITLDLQLPALTIDQPADNSTANRSFVTVAGSIALPVAGVTVAVNGGTAQSAAIIGTSYSATVNLSAGLNTIEAQVTDLSGRRNSLKRSVISSAQGPTLNISTPVQDFRTTVATQTIYGTIADGITPISVSVSDGTLTYTPAVTNGSFSQALTLSATRNYAIAVTVTEGDGGRTTLQRNIWYENRFSINGDQTVTDNLTGLMWAQNADLPIQDISWQQALDYPAAMNSANGGAGTLGHNDWRLPDIGELESLVDRSRSYPALPAGHPFTGVQSAYYWSSTPTSGSFSYIFGVDFGDGIRYGEHKYNFGFVWPVRGERTAASLPAGITGAPYSQQLTASWGTAPYSWSLVSGTLPAGLTLSATGAVTGTTTKPGVYSSAVQIVDSHGTAETRRLAITVTDVACGNQPVRIAGASPVSYADFPGAYAQAAQGAIIQLQNLDFTSDMIFNRDIPVGLQGGYDCGYTGNAGSAGILGSMRVSSGTVDVAKLRFK